MSINRVMISGNLTRDPELRQTTGGMSVLTFGIAVKIERKGVVNREKVKNYAHGDRKN